MICYFITAEVLRQYSRGFLCQRDAEKIWQPIHRSYMGWTSLDRDSTPDSTDNPSLSLAQELQAVTDT